MTDNNAHVVIEMYRVDDVHHSVLAQARSARFVLVHYVRPVPGVG